MANEHKPTPRSELRNVVQSMNATEEPAARGDTREGLIQALSELIIEQDSINISLASIAERAQSNVALVKYYFGNKEGLLIALLKRDVKDAAQTMKMLIDLDKPASWKIVHHVSGLLKFYHKVPYLNRLLRNVIRNMPIDKSRELARDLVGPICRFYDYLIEQGVQEGTFRKIDPMLLYFTIVGACDQLFSNRSVLKALFDVDDIDDDLHRQYTEHTVAILTQGVLKPEA